MQNVLITGVNGFVGRHLAKELFDHGIHVVGVGGPHGNSPDPSHVPEYHVVDLMDANAVATIDFSTIDGVMHLAGLAALGPSFARPLEYIQTNIGMEVNLFEAAMKQDKRPKFVIVSSGGVYDPASPLPMTETSTVISNSPYAVSKIGQEQMGQYYAQRDFEVVIARPFNHIGPGQGPGFVVPDLMQQVIEIEQGKSNKLMVGDLESKRDYTDVRDIVAAYRLLLEKGQGKGGVYNVCSGTSHSVQEVLSTILNTADIHPEVVQDPARFRPSNTPDSYGSHEKITRDTGWKPTISLEQTIADVFADWHAH